MRASSTTLPERTCVGCRRKRINTDLVRCAVLADGTPVVSRTASGRGAWLCADNTSCLRTAIKRRGFERAWKRPVPTTTEHIIEIALGAMAPGDMKSNMEN